MDEIHLSKEIDLVKEIDLSKAELLGKGAFSVVHLVEIDGRKVAVKTLTNRWITRFFHPYDLLLDFKKECDILVELKHPNIIKTLGGSENVLKSDQPEFGILTEYCEMGTLRELIFNPNVLYSMKNVTIWSENLFDALGYMFERKHIHRDIKTENIFVTKDFIVKLGDLGTTRQVDQTCTGTFDVGTLRYLSPLLGPPQEVEQSRKASSRNDVYALGLVIWQLIERRLIFAKYEIEGEFDQGRFFYDVASGNLKGLDPPKCLREFREIVESCCNFDRSERPHIDAILKRLQEFNKESDNAKVKQNLDLNDGYPKIDKNQQELIRPIGFDRLENRELIPIKLRSEPIEKHADMLMKKYDSPETIYLRIEFIKRFNEMSNHEKMGFIEEIEEIIVDAIDGNYKYFHEYFDVPQNEISYLETQLLKEEIPEKRRRLVKLKLEEHFDKMNIKEIFKEIVVRNQNCEMDSLRWMLINYGESWVKESEPTKYSACFLFSQMKALDWIIEIVKKKIRFSNFKFKCFLSSKGEEWILIDSRLGWKNYFSSKSFDKFFKLPKERCFENESVSHSIGDGLLYFDDFIIKKTEFVQLLERTKLKNLTIWKQNICLSSCQTSEIAQEIEKDFPIEIKGRPLFQLSNPPGIHCSHEPKCEIKIEGTELYKNSDEGGSDILAFFNPEPDWIEFLDFFHWDIPKSEMQRNSDPIVFLQVIDDDLHMYITLLDLADEYFNGSDVPSMGGYYVMLARKSVDLHRYFIDTPKNKRRYLVATPLKRGVWNFYALDSQGKEIKESDSGYFELVFESESNSELESDSNSEFLSFFDIEFKEIFFKIH